MHEPLAIGEDADVFAQISPLINNIAAHMGALSEDDIECGADGGTRRLQWAVWHNLPKPAGEVDLSHWDLT